MIAPNSGPSDDWPQERVGYTDVRHGEYAPTPTTRRNQPLTLVRVEEILSSLIAAAGVIWGVRIATTNPSNLDALCQTPGPLEVCAIGILVWLHAKWRRSVSTR